MQNSGIWNAVPDFHADMITRMTEIHVLMSEIQMQSAFSLHSVRQTVV